MTTEVIKRFILFIFTFSQTYFSRTVPPANSA